MRRQPSFLLSIFLGLMTAGCSTVGQSAQTPPAVSMSELLAQAPAADWRPLDPENTLYLDVPAGRVVIELAPAFAPNHVANIKALAREGYFDGSAILRSQENYVVQWGWPEDNRRPIRAARATLPAEFSTSADQVRFTRLPDPDTYAREVGFSDGFPAARGRPNAWLAHCYAMVGAGRDNDADSGGGTELYVVIGQSPRHLDRNVTLVGRVVQGMEILSVMPRGTGDLGFYTTAAERSPIRAMRVAADLPEDQRIPLETLRTDSATFTALVESRRNRRDEWFKRPAGRIGLCNVPLPVRRQPAATG